MPASQMKNMTCTTSSSNHGGNVVNGGVALPPVSIASIQNANWQGRIPIQLSIAPTSLSSPNKPRVLHRMVSRMTYLHLGLFDDIVYLQEYAPTSSSLSSGCNRSKHMMVVREEPPDDSPNIRQQLESENNNSNNDNVDDSSNKQQLLLPADQENSIQKNQKETAFLTHDDQTNEQSTTLPRTTTSTYTLFPECWFEDEESGLPLRWQLFVGVLYDLMKGRLIVNHHQGSSYSCNQFRNLPWKIRIHFTSYPSDQLLPLDLVPQPYISAAINTTNDTPTNNNNSSMPSSHEQIQINTLVGRMFRNSLKQALFLQYGSSKVAMSITKNSHEKLWDAITQCSYDSYHQVNADLQIGVSGAPINNKLSLTDDLSLLTTTTTTKTNVDNKYQFQLPQLVPVRILLNDKPALQKPIVPQKKDISEYLKQRPSEILQDDAAMYVSPYTTLGDVLVLCLPSLFSVDSGTATGGGGGNASRTASTNIISGLGTHYSVQGIQPSFSCTVVDLWRSLCHPDHFLYIVVVTTR